MKSPNENTVQVKEILRNETPDLNHLKPLWGLATETSVCVPVSQGKILFTLLDLFIAHGPRVGTCLKDFLKQTILKPTEFTRNWTPSSNLGSGSSKLIFQLLVAMLVFHGKAAPIL